MKAFLMDGRKVDYVTKLNLFIPSNTPYVQWLLDTSCTSLNYMARKLSLSVEVE